MKRESAYTYTTVEPPGATVHALRTANQWSLRELAEKCKPPLSHTTIARIEQNEGYTSDSIAQVAEALGVAPHELFWPEEVKRLMALPERSRRFVLAVAFEALKFTKEGKE